MRAAPLFLEPLPLNPKAMECVSAESSKKATESGLTPVTIGGSPIQCVSKEIAPSIEWLSDLVFHESVPSAPRSVAPPSDYTCKTIMAIGLILVDTHRQWLPVAAIMLEQILSAFGSLETGSGVDREKALREALEGLRVKFAAVGNFRALSPKSTIAVALAEAASIADSLRKIPNQKGQGASGPVALGVKRKSGQGSG